MVDTSNFPQHRVPPLGTSRVGKEFDANTVPKFLGLYEIESMFDLVAPAFMGIKRESHWFEANGDKGVFKEKVWFLYLF